MSNEWLPLFYAKRIKPEEVYWPEESHSLVYCGIEVTTTNQERIGKCLVVTMELKNGISVSNIIKYVPAIKSSGRHTYKYM